MPAADDMAGRVWIGILLFCGTTLCFATLDMLAKVLARGFDPVQVVWGRYFFHSLVLLPMVLRRGAVRAFATARPAMQIGRALLLCSVTLLFFIAIRHLPLVDAQAISFVMPLVLTGLAHFLLKEKVGPRRWAAVVVGFAGVLLVIRPGGEGGVHWAALLCFAMAVCNAFFHVLTRLLSRTDSAEVAVVYSGFTGAAVFSCLAPFVWIAPDPGEWALLVAIGLMGAAGHYCLSRAYDYARASVLAPYTYLQMVWAAGYGYAVFADVPPPATIAGSGIVVAAGLYIFYRERVGKDT
jgi:drug/metabolite transporter (DMT)-like permease